MTTIKKLKAEDFDFTIPFYMNRGISLGYLKGFNKEMFDFDVFLTTKGKNLQRDFC